jgi:glycosyltransferase involved in cell wall biosynthesis
MRRPADLRSLRILLLSHYYAPEVGAPQTRLRETVRELRALGHDVRVVTGPPHYPDGIVRPGYRAGRVGHETIDDVAVLRLPMLPRPNGGFLDRTIDQSSFAAAAMAAVGPVRWSDVLIVESPPLFLGATAVFHRWTSRRPYLFHVADPWPDIPMSTGALRNPVAIGVAKALEAAAYRNAALITTPTPGLVALLDAKPAAAGRVRLLPNGVDVRRFRPEADRRAAREALGWPVEPFTVVYVGSVGLAQGLATLLDAAALLDDADVLIHVVGGGLERDRLAAEAARRGLRRVRFEPDVPADAVPAVLAASDAVLTLLRSDPIYGHALPTKLVEGLAAGRPSLVAAPGDAGRVVSDAAAGLVAPPEDPAGLAAAIRQLMATESGERDSMGARGRGLAETVFDRRAVVGRLGTYLVEIVRGLQGGAKPS